MSELETAGGIATGTIIARAIEPKRGEDNGRTHETACLNCGAPLTGPYCASCGQQAHVHRTLTALWHDIAHGVFHFEGKVWETLPLLAWRPGEVTRRYIHGERARFISPLALFLFSIFLMFAVFNGIGGPFGPLRTTVPAGVQGSDVEARLAATRADVARIERTRRDAVRERKPLVAIDKALEEARGEEMVLAASSRLQNGLDGGGFRNAFTVNTGSAAFDERVREALGNPKLLLYKMQSSAYKFAWALIPISLPFMWLMFAWRREYHLYDHAVFVTYSLSSVVLLLVIMALVAAIGWPSEMLLFLIPIHFYRQLKQAYLLTRGGALWRTAALLGAATIVISAFGLLLLGLGLSN